MLESLKGLGNLGQARFPFECRTPVSLKNTRKRRSHLGEAVLSALSALCAMSGYGGMLIKDSSTSREGFHLLFSQYFELTKFTSFDNTDFASVNYDEASGPVGYEEGPQYPWDENFVIKRFRGVIEGVNTRETGQLERNLSDLGLVYLPRWNHHGDASGLSSP